MITEAEIQSIDFNSNSCVVRIPFFETLNTVNKIVIPAKFCTQPGIYNGYKVGDIVWVAFENGMPEGPIVIGKVFKSSNDENANGGNISCKNLTVNSTASLPITTKIDGALNKYGTLEAVINNLGTLQESTQTGKIYKQIEQSVGTWINNKTIYSKTFINKNASFLTNTNLIVASLGADMKIDEIIKLDCSVSYMKGLQYNFSNSIVPGSLSEPDGTVSFGVTKNSDGAGFIYGKSTTNTSSVTVTATIWYTKK